MAEKPMIVVKKYKKAHHGSHGGSWKIAYADFVTAMMAFFLLMWLVNAASEETRKGVADYFTASVMTSKSASTGAGMMGGEATETQSGNSEIEVENDANNKYSSFDSTLPNNENQLSHERQLSPNDAAANKTGAKNANLNQQGQAITANSSPKTTVTEEKKSPNKPDATQEKETKQQDKAESIQKIMDNLKQAFNSLEELEKFKHNLIIELTEKGVEIQIIDSTEQEMFKSGSPKPVKYTENVIKMIGKIVADLPNKINITGHTDSKPYNGNGYSNWELSSDRAHVTRRILESCKINGDRFLEVNGRADRDQFNKQNPAAPENRRISITVLYPELQEPQQKNPEDNPVESKGDKAESL